MGVEILKEFAQKYKGKFCISVFCFFRKIFFLSKDAKQQKSICLINAVLLIPIMPYFMTFYVIWCMS